MVRPREIVNVIVEDILRPNINDPKKSRNSDDTEFIYSDSVSLDDDSLKIGVSVNNETGTEMKRLGSLEKYSQTRVQVDVNHPSGNMSMAALDSNFSYPDDVKKPEDAVDYLAERVKDEIVADADTDDKSNSKIRSIGGNDEDVVLEFDQKTPVPLRNDVERHRVFFLVAHE